MPFSLQNKSFFLFSADAKILGRLLFSLFFLPLLCLRGMAKDGAAASIMVGFENEPTSLLAFTVIEFDRHAGA